MGSYERAGIRLAREVFGDQWIRDDSRVYSFGPGGGTGEIDGIVRDEFAVEVAAGSPKQVRASVLDLAFHPIPQKLLLVVATSRQTLAGTVQPAMILHRLGCSGIVFGVVGETGDLLYEGDEEWLVVIVARWRSSLRQPNEVWSAHRRVVRKFGDK